MICDSGDLSYLQAIGSVVTIKQINQKILGLLGLTPAIAFWRVN
jgi:hypothetical protein